MVEKKLSLSKVSKLLKKKTLLCSLWGCENKSHWAYQVGYLVYKDLFKKVILFDPRKNRFEYGSEGMKQRFFSLLNEKRPDYIFLLLDATEFGLDVLQRIKETSPKTKIIAILGDDDIHFFTRSRYYALFIDYCLIAQVQYLPLYKKDGLTNAISFLYGVNTNHFRYLNLDKKYDVSFIGTPIPISRVDLIRFLIKNRIKVNIWGRGWRDYPDLNRIYGGSIDYKEMPKIINKTKIYLGFTKNRFGIPHSTGKFFEGSACKTFCLIENFSEYFKYFNKNSEMVSFNNKYDLLKKIEYYLIHEKERERIAKNAYKKTIKKHNYHIIYKNIFQEIFTIEKKVRLENYFKSIESSEKPSEFSKGQFLKTDDIINRIAHNQKIIELSEKEIYEDYDTIKEKLKNFSYVCFSYGKSKADKYKNYLQVYSLERTKKEISCCEYALQSRNLGRCLAINIYKALKILKKNDFNGLLNINQVMVTKNYFLKNFKKFKEIFNGKQIDIINENNTAFIEIPLVQIEHLSKVNKSYINRLDFDSLKEVFRLNFMIDLFLLFSQKKLFKNFYPYKLFINSVVNGNFFILKCLFNSILSRENRTKLDTF